MLHPGGSYWPSRHKVYPKAPWNSALLGIRFTGICPCGHNFHRHDISPLSASSNKSQVRSGSGCSPQDEAQAVTTRHAVKVPVSSHSTTVHRPHPRIQDTMGQKLYSVIKPHGLGLGRAVHPLPLAPLHSLRCPHAGVLPPLSCLSVRVCCQSQQKVIVLYHLKVYPKKL